MFEIFLFRLKFLILVILSASGGFDFLLLRFLDA